MSLTTDLIGLLILAYFIFRQVTPRPPSRTRFYVLPIVALLIAYHDFPRPTVPPGQLIDALVSVTPSLPFGVMQAYFTTLYQSQGRWLLRGDWRYVLSWLALFALHIATTVLLRPSAGHAVVMVSWIAALEVAVVWGVRSLTLHLRYPELRSILTESPRISRS